MYGAIFKAGNNAIRQSLMDIKGLYLRSSPAHVLVDRVGHQALLELQNSSFCAKGSVTFTFVREPLSHFLSGFTELTFREQKGRAVIDDRFAEETLTSILGGHCPRWGCGNVPHVFPMSGVLAAGWEFDWVGRLEEASTEWEALAKLSAIPQVQLVDIDVHKDDHPSSSDPQGARAAMGAVLRRQRNLRERLCHLLQADYACFGFDIQACFDGRSLNNVAPFGANITIPAPTAAPNDDDTWVTTGVIAGIAVVVVIVVVRCVGAYITGLSRKDDVNPDGHAEENQPFVKGGTTQAEKVAPVEVAPCNR
jgi:hypothetical protein